MGIKISECPRCDMKLGEPYQCSHMGMMYCEFFECPHCGKTFTHVYQFSHIDTDEDDSEAS